MPKAGDLIATRSGDLVGWLIRFGEKRACIGWRKTLWRLATRQIDTPDDPWYFNHIAVCVGDNDLIEALAAGLTRSTVTKYQEFKVLPLSKVLHDPQGIEIDNLTGFATLELMHRAAYDWLSIVSIVVNLLTPLKLSISWEGAMICSAFGARAWEHAGVSIPTAVLTTMPSDLVKLVG